MAIEYPVKITYSNDKSTLKKSQKEVQKGAKTAPAQKGGIGVGGATAAVALGGVLGNMLGSLDSISKLLEVIGGAITAFVAPFVPILLTLLKPFLALFLAVGALLAKWLKFMLSGGTGTTGEGATVTSDEGETTVGTNLLKALGVLAAAIAAIAAVFFGAPVWLVAAIALLAGFIATKLGEPILNAVLKFAGWLDKMLGTDFVGSLKMIFQGFTDVVMGLVDLLWSIVTLDWEGIKAGFMRLLVGLWEVLKGTWMLQMNVLKGIMIGVWKFLKTIWTAQINLLKGIGTWVLDTLKSVFTSSFNVLSNIGSWIKDKIKGFFSFGGGSSRSVNDAIITPSGQVNETNPQDYLIAKKNPGALGGGSTNITVNIQGNADRSVVDEVVRRLQQELRARGTY